MCHALKADYTYICMLPRSMFSRKGLAEVDEHSKCQSIYVNLLQARGLTHVESAFVRELEQTARCDNVTQDLSKLRQAYCEHMGREVYQRVLQYQETLADDRKASQAVMHYGHWSTKSLVSGLNYTNTVWYHTVLQAERTLGLGAAYGGWRAVQHATKAWQRAEAAKGAALACQARPRLAPARLCPAP